MAVVPFQRVVERVVIVQDNPLAVLGTRAGGGSPIAAVSVGHVGLPAQGMVLRGIGDTGHVPTGTRIQTVRLTHHVDEFPVSTVSKGSRGTVDEADGIVTIGDVLPGRIRAVEQCWSSTRMYDQEGLSRGDGSSGGEDVVPEIPCCCSGIGVVGTIGLVGDRVEREAHRPVGRVVDLEVFVVR